MLVVAAFILSHGLLAQTAGGAGWAGARPLGAGGPGECAPLASAAASNVWERAKYSTLRRYCDLLASGAAKLASGSGASEAREAITSADEASRALPGHAAPAVLRGRALVALGQWREAVDAIEGASQKDPHALDDPASLFAWARALGRVGRAADAESAFRSLLPRAAALSPGERGRVELEAALLAEAHGAAGLDEAIALFRQAGRDAQDALLGVAGMGLPLALDRAGEREESRLASGGSGASKRDPREVLSDPRASEALADVGAVAEADALAAFALAERDPTASRDLWTKYLAGPGGKGPWADHARAHVSAPARGTGRGR
jgi:tetratricopeptide (TPR) repeat protein